MTSQIVTGIVCVIVGGTCGVLIMGVIVGGHRDD